MKISELIAHLEKLKEEHGDLTLYQFWEIDRKGNGHWSEISNRRFVFKEKIQNEYDEIISQPGIYF